MTILDYTLKNDWAIIIRGRGNIIVSATHCYKYVTLTECGPCRSLTLLISQGTVLSQFYSSCLPEGITFETQNQIDNFHANYPGLKISMPALLTIYGSYIMMLYHSARCKASVIIWQQPVVMLLYMIMHMDAIQGKKC